VPAKPVWYSKIDQVIAALEAHSRPFVDRATIEFLLGVGRRRAQQIMAPCITERVGSNGLADRDRLISRLRSLAEGDDRYYEMERRRKVAGVLNEMRRARIEQPQVLIEAPFSVVNQEFETLPPGIQLQPGKITVHFEHPREALEKLLALAMAVGNDFALFERLTATDPAQ
jgi:hypothetical protein